MSAFDPKRTSRRIPDQPLRVSLWPPFAWSWPGRHMRRREFITLVGSAGTWPFAARAQQRGMPVVGFLRGGTAAGGANLLAAFRKGLSETGFVEGRNLAIGGWIVANGRLKQRLIWFAGMSTLSLHRDFPWLRWPPRRKPPRFRLSSPHPEIWSNLGWWQALADQAAM